MPTLSPTSRAVAGAIAFYRESAALTVDELSQSLVAAGHSLSPSDVLALEDGERPATVDDLVAIAAALGVSPVRLLTHVGDDLPEPENEQLATGVPDDVVQPQLCAWMEGRGSLDHESRIAYWHKEIEHLCILRAHHDEQREAAVAELRDLGELALQEADAGPVIALHERIEHDEWMLHHIDRSMAFVEQRLDLLRALTQ